MNRHIKYLLVLIGLLFTKDIALVICTSDNPLYWMENVEEHEQKADAKEKEEKKESDDNKFTIATYLLLSANLSFTSLHIVSDRKYCAPSFDVVSPPPERA